MPAGAEVKLTKIDGAAPPVAKRVLVTGGAGFLGSHLCDRLLEEGHLVYCLDNISTGSLGNIRHLLHEPRFFFVMHDVTQPISLDVDEIYNLACPASPVHYQADPIQTTRTCVLGALNVLELARRCGAKVVQASTSEVYGEPAMHPQPESYWGNVNPTGVRSCYDEGKRCAESLFFDYLRTHAVPVSVARIFNTYGPRMQADDGRIVSNLIMQALQHRPLTIYGDGSQTRSFCYVADMIEALVRLMKVPNALPEPVNLGNPYEIPVLELARRVAQLTGTTSPLQFQPLPSDDPTRRRPDITRARKLLHWQPRVPLSDGLNETITFFRSALQVDRAARREHGRAGVAQPAASFGR